MARFADLLALRYDANRTRHAYYRHLRLIHQHFNCDPAGITEAQLREYFLFVKLKKQWKPKTIRQTRAATRMYFVDLLGHADWTLFSQIRAIDHDTLPAVLTRQQVHDLLAHVRLRRYRTPLKLIYCCGLRLSECLGLTIHDILGKENKLIIRNSEGHKDRVLPLPTSMWLVTFTLPSELRACFFGPLAKQAYDLFFAAVSSSLADKLAADKGLRAHVNGFIAALHTWNQRMEFHPHIHCLVPGAGLNARGKPVRVKNAQFLVYLPHLQAAFRQRMRQLMENNGWQADPAIWTKDWGVHIQPAGSGVSALKYLAAYVARTAITDARILQLNHDAVTFRWKDRSDHNRERASTVPGIEFVRRYLRHVLPTGLRSVRHYGFCHPAAKANRMRVQFHTGIPVPFGAAVQAQTSNAGSCPSCPKCGGPTRFILRIHSPWRKRGPPSGKRPNPADCQAASTSRAA